MSAKQRKMHLSIPPLRGVRKGPHQTATTRENSRTTGQTNSQKGRKVPHRPPPSRAFSARRRPGRFPGACAGGPPRCAPTGPPQKRPLAAWPPPRAGAEKGINTAEMELKGGRKGAEYRGNPLERGFGQVGCWAVFLRTRAGRCRSRLQRGRERGCPQEGNERQGRAGMCIKTKRTEIWSENLRPVSG